MATIVATAIPTSHFLILLTACLCPRRVIRRTACAGTLAAGRGRHELGRAAILAAPRLDG
jgi:hypothetical protein